MKNIENLSMDEIENIQEQINNRKEELKQNKIKERQEIAEKHIEKLRENKDLILSLINHDRTSCSDDNVCNGYGSADYGARCNKCHLIEILNGEWGNRFDVELKVEIFDTEA